MTQRIVAYFLFFLITLLPNHVFAQSTTTRSPIVPKTDLSFWNTTQIRPYNNCYNYSTNRVTNNFAQPGEASGKMYTSVTCAVMIESASQDLGLTPTVFFPHTGNSDQTLIALVVSENFDFHWYRRDSDGMWSHKPGSTRATILDNSRQPITDPETANRGWYKDFCGYFKVTSFPDFVHEQNGGYVRIGDMMDLPGAPVPAVVTTPVATTPAASVVEALIYSGRRNPQIKLSDILKDQNLMELFQDVRDQVRNQTSVSQSQLAIKNAWDDSILGYNGIAIHDEEGLIFAKGTTVYVSAIKGTAVEYQGHSFYLDSPAANLLEGYLREHFAIH